MQDAPYKLVPVKAGATTLFAKVSPEDYERISAFNWRLLSGYPVTRIRRSEGRVMFQMGREVLGLKKGDGIECDHINRDPLDNRRENLRAVSHHRNVCNAPSRGGSSRYRGVSWVTRDQAWHAQARFKSKTRSLGNYANEDDAARAVNIFWTSVGCEPPNDID